MPEGHGEWGPPAVSTYATAGVGAASSELPALREIHRPTAWTSSESEGVFVCWKS